MANRHSSKQIYKVIFLNQGKIYELFARHVYQGELYGFIQVEELIFGEKSTVLVDPAEERLRGEFTGVRRSYIPIHSVVRIDEVEKEGASRIHSAGESGDNVATFPHPGYLPGDRGKPK